MARIPPDFWLKSHASVQPALRVDGCLLQHGSLGNACMMPVPSTLLFLPPVLNQQPWEKTTVPDMHDPCVTAASLMTPKDTSGNEETSSHTSSACGALIQHLL